MHLQPRLGFVLACIFLDALGVGLIVPVLPRLVGTLTNSAQSQTLWYGALMASYGVMQFISSPMLGALSDRIGRRPVLLGGIFGLGLMFAVPAFSTSLWLILVSRIVGGMLSANMAVAQAYIADITTGNARAGAFGKIGAVFGIGFVVGPTLGGVLGNSDPALPFAVAAVVALLNFLYGLFVLPESLQQKETRPLSARVNNPFSSIAELFSSPDNRFLALTFMLSSLTNGLTQCSWALYTEYRYGFTPMQIGISVFALGLSISFVQGVVLQKALTRFEPNSINRTALAVGALMLFCVALVPDGAVASVLFCLSTVSGCVSPLIMSSISRRTPVTKQGKTIGSVSSLNSLTGALAPAIATPLLMITGTFRDTWAVGTPFFSAALLLVCGCILFSAEIKRRRQSETVRLPLDED